MATIVEVLIAHGADVNIKDNLGFTPLDLLMISTVSLWGDRQVARILIRHEAKITLHPEKAADIRRQLAWSPMWQEIWLWYQKHVAEQTLGSLAQGPFIKAVQDASDKIRAIGAKCINQLDPNGSNLDQITATAAEEISVLLRQQMPETAMKAGAEFMREQQMNLQSLLREQWSDHLRLLKAIREAERTETGNQ